jgi:hypothetical protein
LVGLKFNPQTLNRQPIIDILTIEMFAFAGNFEKPHGDIE